ncbi:MAG: aldehyde ferredoxin oxidoreductase C-terminal domain-containing protein, partial [Desulfobacterales bacterium]|nr:aldehyde ferredoxin oxidoreductase C-terminal domain-containing protein [Desulfobacterales bacterium]
LSWGNADGIEQLLNDIANNKGIGSTLKLGVHKAAQAIGNGADACDFTAKGLEFTGYDPRGMMGVALGYALSSRGGDFCSVYNIPESRFTQERAVSEFGTEDAINRFSLEGKAALIQRCMAVSAVIDSLGLCKVPALSLVGEFDLKNEAALVTALTHLEMNFLDLLQAGERIITEERLVNLALSPEGLDDTISEKFLTIPITEGPAKGSRVDLGPMLAEFYQRMGWDESGVPEG